MMDRDFEIKYKDEQIQDLRDALAGTKKEKGSFNEVGGRWEINYSSILTKLIQEAGRWCECHASDLFALWSSIEQKLENGTLGTDNFVFAFKEIGVDDKEPYKRHKANRNYYRAVWFLDVTVNGDKIEMILHK